MPDPIPAALPGAPAAAPAPAAPKPVASPAPAPVAQPTPAAAPKLGAPVVAPAPAAPAPGTVPLASLMEEREKRQALQAEMDQLRNTVNQIQQRQQPQPGFQAPQQTQVDLKAQLDKLWVDDPRKAVQMEIMLSAQWQDNINAQVDGEAAQLAAKYRDFNDYRDTAMRYVRALPLDQRARQGIVEMAYLVTRGQNVDQIIEANRQALAAQFQQNPAMFQMPAGPSAGTVIPSQVQASEAQIRAAGAMKVPIDQYMKWVK